MSVSRAQRPIDRACGITWGDELRKAQRIIDARQREKDDLLARIHSLAASSTIRDKAFVNRVLADATRLLDINDGSAA